VLRECVWIWVLRAAFIVDRSDHSRIHRPILSRMFPDFPVFEKYTIGNLRRCARITLKRHGQVRVVLRLHVAR
jgi:hypothetical protein